MKGVYVFLMLAFLLIVFVGIIWLVVWFLNHSVEPYTPQ